jgi:hypothetical protein
MLALAFALAACGSATPTKPNTPSLEQRMLELEGRVEKLEARPEVKPPFRSKAEIQANIQALEAERGQLLIRYLPQHPAIRDIDRSLEILRAQLKTLE